MKPLKPYMRKCWRIGEPPNFVYFFTCARPGRTGDPASRHAPVPDDLVHRWVLGLPSPHAAIVSLLGRKPDGLSEFSFYSFYGGFDLPSEHTGRLSFQQWLDRWHKDRSIVVREHPTCDFETILTETRDAVARDINELLSVGRTVILVDSGGQTRTRVVCNHMHAVEDSSRL